MSQKIITLPQELANQIAAGEVVERPVSVVKELIENSLDAGATSVKVRLKNGGIDLIEVRDNGVGIWEKDLPKALKKYSTSKITNLQDLQEVMTFGFRWEALASISSVSRFTISSNTGASQGGKSLSYRDSNISKITEVAHERGTTIRVESLFYNTPARLNYLKTPRTEYLKIQECIQKMALLYPEREFSLEHDGKQTQYFPKWQGLTNRIYTIYGEEFSENLLEIRHEFNAIHIHWVISKPQVSFRNKSRQAIYVNQRIVNSPIIMKAITDAYNRFIAPKTFPAYVLFIEVDPTQVDVNVHPRKMEVRFASEQSLFRSVYHGVQNVLEGVSLVHPQNIDSPQREESRWIAKQEEVPPGIQRGGSVWGMTRWVSQKYHTSSWTNFRNYSPYTNTEANPAQEAINFSKEVLWDGAKADIWWDIRETPLWKILGQAHRAYILVENHQGIQILDQHALAERVIYERLAHSSYTPKSQQILWGVSLKLTSLEQEVFEKFQDIFQNMGFDIESLSHGLISLQSLPDFVVRQNVEDVFRSILADIGVEWSKNLEEIRHKIWAYTACRSAVKFGDSLSIFEMSALLRDASLDYSATCPHGRPVVYDIDLESLQKKYER